MISHPAAPRFLCVEESMAQGNIWKLLWEYEISWAWNPGSVVQQTHEPWEKKSCWAWKLTLCWETSGGKKLLCLQRLLDKFSVSSGLCRSSKECKLQTSWIKLMSLTWQFLSWSKRFSWENLLFYVLDPSFYLRRRVSTLLTARNQKTTYQNTLILYPHIVCMYIYICNINNV